MTRDQLERAYPCPAATHRHNTCCALHRKRLDLIEDYLFIGGDRLSGRQAAERLGISQRSIARYRAALKTALRGTT